MTKQIKFGSVFEHIGSPKPAKECVPEWYKKGHRFIGGIKPRIEGGSVNRGIKLCIPFFESFTTGYTVELWQDVYVKYAYANENTNPFLISWKVDPPVVSSIPPGMAHTFEPPAGHDKNLMAWWNPHVIQTPPGYSILITHPLNRFDLPFTTTSGVVDSDGVLPSTAVIPFFMKEGFEGLIPAGTPLFQVIPFRRESWKSSVSKELAEKSKQSHYDSTKVTHGWYKKNLWAKKSYE